MQLKKTVATSSPGKARGSPVPAGQPISSSAPNYQTVDKSSSRSLPIPRGLRFQKDLIWSLLQQVKLGQLNLKMYLSNPSSLLTEPAEQVLTVSGLTSTGSTQTSALALGLATSAVKFIERESLHRPRFIGQCRSFKKNNS